MVKDPSCLHHHAINFCWCSYAVVGSICFRPSHEREVPVLTIVGSDVDTCLLTSNSLPRLVFCKNGKHYFFEHVLREAPPSSDLQKDAQD